MALRLYFSNDAPTYTASALGPWDTTTGFVSRALGPRTGANTSRAVTKSVSTTNYDMLHGSWVSEPFTVGMTIPSTDTLGLTIGRVASAITTFYSELYVVVLAGSTNTPRGVWRSAVGSSYWGNAQGNGGWNPAALGTTLAVQAGDRLVIEQGVRAVPSTTGVSATIWYGNGGGADYSITPADGDVTTGVGWAELVGASEGLWVPQNRGLFQPF